MRRFLIFVIAARAFACQIVEGDRILGKDLAAASGSFAAIDSELAIGAAPLAGVTRVLHASDLAKIAGENGIILEAPASELCFQRATELLTSEKLMPALKSALEDEAATIEILEFSRFQVPRGRLEFTRAGFSQNGFWRGRMVYGDGRTVPVWAKVRVTGGAGQVSQGDRVSVEVISGGALLAFEGTAGSSGRIGESIRVRNPGNGKWFQAQVEGKGKVAVRK
jgi:hypothetical protein